MFLLLTQLLLWLLIATIFYYIMIRLIPRPYLTWFGGLILFIFVALAFISPGQSGLVSDALNILTFPFKPLGLSLVLLLSALRQGAKKVVGNQVMAATLILLLSSVPILASGLAQQAEREAIQFEQQRGTQIAAPTAGAIVVLAQGVAQGNPTLNDTSARLLYTAQLYQQQSALGNPPVVIVNTNIDPNEITRQLGRAGVPSNEIVVEPRGADLRSSAEEVNRILKSRGVTNRRILLVSPAISSRRASQTFANLGITVIPRSTDFFSSLNRSFGSLRVENFVPNVQALAITTRVVEEVLTTVYYFLRGWLVPIVT